MRFRWSLHTGQNSPTECNRRDVGTVRIGLGRLGRVDAASRQVGGLDDLREEAHALLLESLAGQGRSAEAIEHYERAVALFEEALGVAPGALRRPLEKVGLLL
ncbi:MAG: bacterial transcriptional activator domain-containing protein [Vulcanimicrobiota bacterium]